MLAGEPHSSQVGASGTQGRGGGATHRPHTHAHTVLLRGHRASRDVSPGPSSESRFTHQASRLPFPLQQPQVPQGPGTALTNSAAQCPRDWEPGLAPACASMASSPGGNQDGGWIAHQLSTSVLCLSRNADAVSSPCQCARLACVNFIWADADSCYYHFRAARSSLRLVFRDGSHRHFSSASSLLRPLATELMICENT